MRAVLGKRGIVETFRFKGDLKKEVEKCKRELNSKKNDIGFYLRVFEKSKKEYNSIKNRIDHLEEFIDLAEKELVKEKTDHVSNDNG